MEYQFPIIIDIKKPNKMLISRTLTLSASAILFYKLFGYNGIIFCLLITGIMVLVSTILGYLYKDSIKKPKFIIYSDHVVVKKEFLRFVHYPFEWFKGRIYLKRRQWEWFLYVPNAPAGQQYIHISCLAKPEREQLIAILKELIES